LFIFAERPRMTQYLKEDVRARIDEAALDLFSAQGYQGATMAAIARAAGISTGNVYRYYSGKEALFETVVPPALVRRFRELLAERLGAARGMADVRDLPDSHAYWVAAGRLLDFTVRHRRETIVLLGNSAGTRYERVGREVVDELVDAAKAHAPSLASKAEARPAVAFDLEEIYRNYVASLVRILKRFADGKQIREATRTYERYHLGGLAGLLR
jgi:AcrR family transcriptional regulator